MGEKEEGRREKSKERNRKEEMLRMRIATFDAVQQITTRHVFLFFSFLGLSYVTNEDENTRETRAGSRDVRSGSRSRWHNNITFIKLTRRSYDNVKQRNKY